MPSPQGSTGPYSPARLPHRDSTNSGENMYGMMKPNMPGSMPGFPMGGPEGGLGGMGPDMPPVMNGDGMAGDGMKHSPHNGGPGTPREEMPPVSSAPGEMGYNIPYQDNVSVTPVSNPPPQDQNESAEILKIKQSMQEEAKRFEKDTP